MKVKIINLIYLILIAAILFWGFKAIIDIKMNNYYPLSTIVTEVDEDTDIVTVQDFNGNVWQFMGAEDWAVNDVCALIMDSKGTATIYDDEIISKNYCGYLLTN